MGKPWVCLWERLIKETSDFVLVHDGQKNPGQFKFPAAEVRFYTRTYHMVLEGKPVRTWVKFKYDLREGEVSVDVTWHDPAERKVQESMAMAVPKEVMDGGKQTT